MPLTSKRRTLSIRWPVSPSVPRRVLDPKFVAGLASATRASARGWKVSVSASSRRAASASAAGAVASARSAAATTTRAARIRRTSVRIGPRQRFSPSCRTAAADSTAMRSPLTTVARSTPAARTDPPLLRRIESASITAALARAKRRRGGGQPPGACRASAEEDGRIVGVEAGPWRRTHDVGVEVEGRRPGGRRRVRE